MSARWPLLICGIWLSLSFVSPAPADEYRAGLARAVITPTEPIWMAGYASRTKPAEGKDHDLFAKALAMEDAGRRRLVLVTTDILSYPRDLADEITGTAMKKTGLRREQIILSGSHTHCGPVIRGPLFDMYDLPADQLAKLAAYRKELSAKVVKVIADAVADLQPAQLSIGKGTARFAVNRRQNVERDFLIGSNPKGPVDHDVPVLKISSPGGKLRAVVFGYACHNTTLDYYLWSGDYAGYAQMNLEMQHPGVQAMFWAGCGGDANPMPRRTVELCRKHGKELATAVEDVLATSLTPIRGEFQAKYETIAIPFDTLPTREQWQADSLSKTYALKTRAKRMLQTLDAGGKIEDHYPAYPVQVWRLGDQIVWIALGGEVVVDYALRLKKELGKDRPVWVMAYANDVMAYIPSLRVLKEGGYEGKDAMVYYGQPAKWGEEVEERIVRKVHEMVGK